MNNPLVETIATYKMGHQRFDAKIAVSGKNLQRIEEVPPEVPEHMDGALSRIQFFNGETVFVTEAYDTLLEKWKEALRSEIIE